MSALSVTGPSGTEYPIEPLRFSLALTRVQMVDAHLHSILRTGEHREDTDELLDARNTFAFAPGDPLP